MLAIFSSNSCIPVYYIMEVNGKKLHIIEFYIPSVVGGWKSKHLFTLSTTICDRVQDDFVYKLNCICGLFIGNCLKFVKWPTFIYYGKIVFEKVSFPPFPHLHWIITKYVTRIIHNMPFTFCSNLIIHF